MPLRKIELCCYVAFLFLTFFFIGSSLVTVSWIAIETNSIAVVGKIFFLSSLTGIVVSVIGGVLTDSRDRKSVIRLGLIVQISASLLLLYGVMQKYNLPPFLYLFSILNTASMAIKAGAIDSAFQAIISKERRVVMSLRLSIVRQLGLAIGMGGSGVLLDQTNAVICITLLLIISVIRFFMSETFLRKLKPRKKTTSPNPIQLWKEGFKYSINDKRVLIAIFGVALTFSVAQMTNVLVPGFVYNELSAGSDVYGLLEMAWSVGGGIILFAAALKRHASPHSNLEAFLLCILGITMIVFSFLRSVPILTLFYSIMGGLFSFTRAIFDGKILTFCQEDKIGRTRASTSILTNMIGMTIYLIPSIFPINAVSYLYIAWGTIILFLGLAIFYLMPSQSQNSSTQSSIREKM